MLENLKIDLLAIIKLREKEEFLNSMPVDVAVVGSLHRLLQDELEVAGCQRQLLITKRFLSRNCSDDAPEIIEWLLNCGCSCDCSVRKLLSGMLG